VLEAQTTPAVEETRVVVVAARSGGDRIYRLLAYGAGVLTFVLMGSVALLLVTNGWDALRVAGWRFVTTFEFNPVTSDRFGIAASLYGTVVIALVALTIAVPISVTASIFIVEYAPRRAQGFLVGLVDLLAAVPSLIYGLWGFFFLQPRLIGLSRWLADHLGFIPIFATSGDDPAFVSSPFVAGVVVALMVVPICTSVTREVLSQTPPVEKEGALALGGTQWGMIRDVVLPFGKGGIIGASMLGLGRALGETIAVTIIIAPAFDITPRILERGANSVASLITIKFKESSGVALSALMAAGLALFLLTLGVNALAAVVVSRSRSGAGVEL
jgi:phosphate transport system permease protein